MKTRAAKGRSLFSLAALCLALVAVPAQAARLLPSSPSLDAAPRVAELVDLERPSSSHAAGLPLFTLQDHWLVTLLSVVDAPDPGELLPRERYRLFAESQSLPPPVRAALLAKLASGLQTWPDEPISLGRSDLGEKSHRLSFQGLWTDPATGLAYARNRWYDPHNAAWMSEDPALDVDSTNLYAFVGWGPQESTDPTGEVALIDNAIGGVVSVAIGWGSSKLCEHFAKTDEDKASCAYSWKDATIDFGLGFATSGLSSINKVAKLGKVGRFVIRGVAEMALDTGLEAARKEWKGEDYDLGTLAQGAARNFAIGEAGSLIGRKLVGKFKKAIDFSEDVADSFRAPGRGLRQANVQKLADPEYVADLHVRLSQRALRKSLASGREGTTAGRFAEEVFSGYAGRTNRLLGEAGSNYHVYLQQAARRSGDNVGTRVTAWNRFTGRWRSNTKRLDWIISDLSGKPNRNGLLEGLYGADFTVTRGGAAGVAAEYGRAFPRTQLIGIDPTGVVW